MMLMVIMKDAVILFVDDSQSTVFFVVRCYCLYSLASEIHRSSGREEGKRGTAHVVVVAIVYYPFSLFSLCARQESLSFDFNGAIDDAWIN